MASHTAIAAPAMSYREMLHSCWLGAYRFATDVYNSDASAAERYADQIVRHYHGSQAVDCARSSSEPTPSASM